MKNIFFISSGIIWIILITSCGKGEVNTMNQAPKPIPTLAITASSDTVLYGSKSTISWSSTNATSGSGSVNSPTGFFETPPLTATTTYSITVTGPGGSITKTKEIYVWSQRRSQMESYASVKMVYNRGFAGADSSSGQYVDGVIDCNIYRYNANGVSHSTIGSCNQNAGAAATSHWTFQDSAEQWIFFDGGYLWKITLKTDGFDLEKVENGHYTVVKYRKI